MFLFDIGIEHESDTAGQRLVNRTTYASSGDIRNWQAAIKREFAKNKNKKFASKLESLNVDVATRKTDALLRFIVEGVAGLKELEDLRQTDFREQGYEKRSDAALYRTALSVMAIFKCFENNWAEPLRLALDDKRVDSKELRNCISEWVRNTDKVMINLAINERNLGLMVDFLARYSNSDATGDQLIVYSIIEECYNKSWRAPLEKYLEKNATTYPNFRGPIESYLNKMGPAIEKSMESVVRQRKGLPGTIPVGDKHVKKETAKR